jgi:plastocyanin
VAFTVASGTVAAPGSARSRVLVRDLRTGALTIAGRANGRHGAVGDAFSADPSISPDGRYVAFTSTDPALGGRKGEVTLYLRDLQRGRTVRIPTGDARPLDPAVSSGGRVLAFTAVRGQAASVLVWHRATGRVAVVSRATGRAGAIADGWSGDPSVSADGRRVAFASTASTLSARKADDTRGVFVRDLRAGSTRLVSAVEKAYAGRTLPKPPATPAPPAPAPPKVVLRAGAADDAAATVLVTDNAFVDDVQRPVVRVKQGAEVRWLWRSRQSHSVQVSRGPVRFASSVRNRGGFRHRFTQPGTYELVCSLHAPGMKATVVVDPSA